MELTLLVGNARQKSPAPAQREPLHALPHQTCTRLLDVPLDLLIRTSMAPAPPSFAKPEASPGSRTCKTLSFGFPNTDRHAFYPHPWLGYEGWACFVGDLINAFAGSGH